MLVSADPSNGYIITQQWWNSTSVTLSWWQYSSICYHMYKLTVYPLLNTSPQVSYLTNSTSGTRSIEYTSMSSEIASRKSKIMTVY